jgi:hypothetical protein
MTDQSPKPKALLLKDLAKQYKVDERTFKNWIKPFLIEIGEKIGQYYTPKQVETIYNKLGAP